MQYELKPQTLIILVGPSNAGKTYFADMFKTQVKQDYPIAKVIHIASDFNRSFLLDQIKFDKMASWMYEVSEPAFDMYYQNIESAMKFPVDAEVIIADATNLKMSNITRLTELAHKYKYNVDYVVFYYNRRKDYFKYTDEFTTEYITHIHYKKMHDIYKNILSLNKKTRHGNVYCLHKHVDSIQIDYDNSWYVYFNKQYYTDYKNVVVIGDIHGQYEAMQELLDKFDISVENQEIKLNNSSVDLLVFTGDYIDKCPYENTVWMIDFVDRNIDSTNIIFLRGNHERFVYHYLNRTKSYLQTSKELVDNYFTSVKYLYQDDDTRQKFLKWYKKTLKFIKLPNCIVCHAPVDKQLMCKVNTDTMIKGEVRHGTSTDAYLKYFMQLGNFEPLVVFGHVSTQYPFVYKNVVFIDGGADKGNLLCGCYIDKRKNVKFKTVKVDSNEKEHVENFHIFIRNQLYEQKKIQFDELEPLDLYRLRYLKRKNIRFLSGTMPPAWATDSSIEDIDTVFDYYKKHGIDEVILEPKYMGSRINVYLDCVDVSKTQFVTRGGYIAYISNENKEKLLKQCERWIDSYKNKCGALPKSMIIDGELLPWATLGQDLIDNTFNLYYKLVQSELKILSDTGFDKLFLKKKEELESMKELSKEDIIENYGHHIYRLSKVLQQYHHIPIADKKAYISLFKKQLDLYANSDVSIEIKPFNVLCIDDFILPLDTHEQTFTLFNNDSYCLVDVNDISSRQKGKEFFHTLSYDRGFEGIVIKPNKIDKAVFNNVVPYFKVRNEDYLLIIYGYLYKEYYNRFIKSKNRSMKAKIAACLQEWNAGLKMLQAKTSSDFTNAYLEFKYGENIEVNVDPRL